MEKKKLNILFDEDTFPKEVLNFFEQKFDVNVIKLGEEKPDLIVFTDGEDIDPSMYGDVRLKDKKVDASRDKRNCDLYYKVKLNTLKVGFGRGAHLLAVMSGSYIIQQIENHDKPHYLSIEGYGNYNVESNHTSMMFPYSINNKENYEVLGWSKNFKSCSYLNGHGEEIDLPMDFLEPEIVKFKSKALCFEPNVPLSENTEFKNASLELIERFLNEGQKTSEKPSMYYLSPEPLLVSSRGTSHSKSVPDADDYVYSTPSWMSSHMEKANRAKSEARDVSSGIGLDRFGGEKTLRTKKSPARSHQIVVGRTWSDPASLTNLDVSIGKNDNNTTTVEINKEEIKENGKNDQQV